MRAKDIMQQPPLVLDAAATVSECVQRMDREHHGYAIVLRDGVPSGIVTEWDLLHKVLAAGVDPTTTTAGAIASVPLVSVDAETTTYDLVDAMADRGIRRVAVTQNGRVVGVVTSREVLRSFRQYIDQLSSQIGRMQAPPP